jgi:cysteine synthase B
VDAATEIPDLIPFVLLWAALQLSKEVQNAVIVSIVCDRGDRYLSTGVFPA